MGPAAKRRKIESKVEEVNFDYDARQEYLTGFHKRKVQRTKAAQDAAARRARQERIEERKKLREERKTAIERHVSEVNALLKGQTENVESDQSEDEAAEVWEGLEDPDTALVDHEEEYIDEDKYTTVTVEAVNVSRDGLETTKKTGRVEDENSTPESDMEKAEKANSKPTTKKRSRDSSQPKKRKKKRNFRYENKADRKMNRAKVRAKNAKAAAARKDKSS